MHRVVSYERYVLFSWSIFPNNFATVETVRTKQAAPPFPLVLRKIWVKQEVWARSVALHSMIWVSEGVVVARQKAVAGALMMMHGHLIIYVSIPSTFFLPFLVFIFSAFNFNAIEPKCLHRSPSLMFRSLLRNALFSRLLFIFMALCFPSYG